VFEAVQVRGKGMKTQRPGAVAYTGSLSRGVREVCLSLQEALPHRGGKARLPRDQRHIRSMPSGMREFKERGGKLVKP
jgi:hypothetical protein